MVFEWTSLASWPGVINQNLPNIGQWLCAGSMCEVAARVKLQTNHLINDSGSILIIVLHELAIIDGVDQ